MGTKENPSEFDCYRNAHDDEPMFVLLARDESAPGLVREWVYQRNVRKGLDAMARDAKAEEALACADAMEAWLAGPSAAVTVLPEPEGKPSHRLNFPPEMNPL
jgi:hypothetical protein